MEGINSELIISHLSSNHPRSQTSQRPPPRLVCPCQGRACPGLPVFLGCFGAENKNDEDKRKTFCIFLISNSIFPSGALWSRGNKNLFMLRHLFTGSFWAVKSSSFPCPGKTCQKVWGNFVLQNCQVQSSDGWLLTGSHKLDQDIFILSCPYWTSESLIKIHDVNVKLVMAVLWTNLIFKYIEENCNVSGISLSEL